MRKVLFAVLALSVAPLYSAEEPPKPGPEHAELKKMEGTWDVTMKMMGMEAKGTNTWKMGLGGFWLIGDFQCELFGSKFQGMSHDSYDAGKKKYVSVWIDSMSSGMVSMEGDFDKAKKTLTQEGTGPGQDGKPTKYKSTSTWTDENTIDFSMWIGDGKDPMFTITYKKKK